MALRALAHPGRRQVLELVAGNERTASELAQACGWTRPAASQHLAVLREAGLVEVHARGNRRLYRANAQRLAEVRSFLDDFWGRRLAALAERLDGAADGSEV
jgi:DNA-binding transcriptional ArsR family regulator